MNYPKSFTRLHLKDEGQDLLWIDIQEGDILGAGPFHNDLYEGQCFYNFYQGKLPKKGDLVRYSKGPKHPVHTIKWPIVRIERVMNP